MDAGVSRFFWRVVCFERLLEEEEMEVDISPGCVWLSVSH